MQHAAHAHHTDEADHQNYNTISLRKKHHVLLSINCKYHEQPGRRGGKDGGWESSGQKRGGGKGGFEGQGGKVAWVV